MQSGVRVKQPTPASALKGPLLHALCAYPPCIHSVHTFKAHPMSTSFGHNPTQTLCSPLYTLCLPLHTLCSPPHNLCSQFNTLCSHLHTLCSPLHTLWTLLTWSPSALAPKAVGSSQCTCTACRDHKERVGVAGSDLIATDAHTHTHTHAHTHHLGELGL